MINDREIRHNRPSIRRGHIFFIPVATLSIFLFFYHLLGFVFLSKETRESILSILGISDQTVTSYPRAYSSHGASFIELNLFALLLAAIAFFLLISAAVRLYIISRKEFSLRVMKLPVYALIILIFFAIHSYYTLDMKLSSFRGENFPYIVLAVMQHFTGILVYATGVYLLCSPRALLVDRLRKLNY